MTFELTKEFPSLAREIVTRLEALGESALAVEVPSLKIQERCRVKDDFCATMYTGLRPPPGQPYGPGHRSVDLEVDDGYLILDVVQQRIVCVEVLYRDGVRQRLHEVMP